jgi:membrane associated rhomboid family serine protease
MSERKGTVHRTPKAYIGSMVALARVVRVLILMLLAFVAISLVIGLGTSGTGVIEKAVLLALIAGCVFLAAKVPTLATRTQTRLQRH